MSSPCPLPGSHRASRGEGVLRTHPLSASVTERHSLPPSSLLRCLVSVPYGSPSLAGRPRGDFVHLLDRSGVRSFLSAGSASSATANPKPLVPDHVPFWSKPVSIFGLPLDHGL